MKNPLLPLCALLCLPGASYAEINFSPYMAVAVEAQSSEIGGAEFDNTALLVQAGAWLWEGIGFELEFGQSMGDDSDGGLYYEPTQILRYGLRLQTPSTPEDPILYLLFSGASASIDLHSDASALPGENSFDGYHAAIGLGSQISPGLMVDLSYNNYQVDESFDITGLRLSLHYAPGAQRR